MLNARLNGTESKLNLTRNQMKQPLTELAEVNYEYQSSLLSKKDAIDIIEIYRGLVMKPKIELLKDEYALETGQYWVCIHAGICARGKTPELAYNSLMSHFKDLRETRAVGPAPIRAKLRELGVEL